MSSIRKTNLLLWDQIIIKKIIQRRKQPDFIIHKKGFTIPDSIYSACKLNSYRIITGGLTFKCARWYSKRTFALAMLSTVPTNTKGTWPSSRGIVGCGSLSPSILTRTWNKHRWKTMVPFQRLDISIICQWYIKDKLKYFHSICWSCIRLMHQQIYYSSEIPSTKLSSLIINTEWYFII